MRELRVAIVGASTDFGHRVKELLEQRVVLTDLKLFTTGDESPATLARFRDEVVVSQPLDLDLLTRLDAVFVAGDDSPEVNEAARRAADEGILTFVSRAIDLDAPVVGFAAFDALDVDNNENRGSLYIVPRTPSWLVGTCLRALSALGAVEQSVATVLVPADEWGVEASEELHQQILQLLNFQAFPAQVFEEQVAFNIGLAGRPSLRARCNESLEWEARRLSGGDGDVHITAVQAPMFHGYAANLWVAMEGAPSEAAVYKHFQALDGFAVAPSRRGVRKEATPATVADSGELHVGNVRVTSGSVSLWLVSNSLAYDPALRAVELMLARLDQHLA